MEDPVMSVSVIVWVIVLIVFIILPKNKDKTRNIINATNNRGVNKNNLTNLHGKTISSDGHTVPKEQDLTCETLFGHKHPATKAMESEFGRRYIVHEEPETGYVILNGRKRRLSDLKDE